MNMDFDTLCQTCSHLWGNTVDEAVQKAVSYFLGKEVLDLGAGDGRNALYLLEKWFHLECVDISTIGLQKIEEKAEKYSWKLTTHVEDLNAYQFSKTHENIVCTFVLHFLTKKKARELISHMQHATTPWGIHVLCGFTSSGELDIPEISGVFTIDELSTLYEDWEMIFSQQKPDRVRKWAKTHEIYSYIARKSKKTVSGTPLLIPLHLPSLPKLRYV